METNNEISNEQFIEALRNKMLDGIPIPRKYLEVCPVKVKEITLSTWDEVRLYIDELVKDGQIEKEDDINKFEFVGFSQDKCRSCAHNCLISYNNR